MKIQTAIVEHTITMSEDDAFLLFASLRSLEDLHSKDWDLYDQNGKVAELMTALRLRQRLTR